MTPHLYGSTAKMALQFLKSGRAFKEGGAETFEKLLRSLDRKLDPTEAVSEFRKLINAIETEAVQTGISNRIAYGSGRRTPWSEAKVPELSSKVDEYFEPVARGQYRALNYDTPNLSTYHIEKAKSYDTMAGTTKGKQRAWLRRLAALHRSNAAIYDALYKLFGGQTI